MNRELLQQALAALENHRDLASEDAAEAIRAALAAPQPEPVALESVHLTRDTHGMCVVRVNGRVAIRDNGDIIDHMATLEWFAAPPAAPADMVMVPKNILSRLIDEAYLFEASIIDKDAVEEAKQLLAAAPAPAVPARCTYCDDTGDVNTPTGEWRGRCVCKAGRDAAPAVREPLTREQQIAIREAHCNTASDEYFGARPQVDDATKRRIYEAGFKEGWESAHGIGGGGNG